MSISYLNQLLDETIQCANENGSADTFTNFEIFVNEMLPPDMLELLLYEANANLEDIWKENFERYVCEEDELINCCLMCEREIHLTKHHLIPREMHERFLKKSSISKEELNQTIAICRMCHSTIHRFFSNKELAEKYNTFEALMADEKIFKYAKWASGLKQRGNKGVY